MENRNIIIRKAVPADAQFIALVVCMALGADDTHYLYSIFKELAARSDAQYSYCNVLVAEVDGVVAGAVVGYDGGRLHELRVPLHDIMQKRLGYTISIEDETGEGEFYVDSLAVLPQFRGRGIGRMLLVEACERAFADGFGRVGLLVDVENPGAEALYTSLGFKRINPTTLLGHAMWHLQFQKTSDAVSEILCK